MLDSSRHFLSMKVLMDQLDLMEMNKINVFHWHLTDDPSFPFVSQTFPNLTHYGAFDSETHVYNPDDVRKIVPAHLSMMPLGNIAKFSDTVVFF